MLLGLSEDVELQKRTVTETSQVLSPQQGEQMPYSLIWRPPPPWGDIPTFPYPDPTCFPQHLLVSGEGESLPGRKTRGAFVCVVRMDAHVSVCAYVCTCGGQKLI